MKTCWEILGIEATTDIDAIRQAYLALLPSFHPETDPQGFKQLREAYENALQGTKSPAITVVEEDPDTPWVNSLQEIFRDLLADDERRFQPQAWQEFIQQINKLSISQVEKSRWWLCAIAMQTFPVSYSCLKLLSDRLAWEQGPIIEKLMLRRWRTFCLKSIVATCLIIRNCCSYRWRCKTILLRFMRRWSRHFLLIRAISQS
ncbi:molecular chaperone [Salmonella enterica subsp. salamae]|nr:molecular chaperone [Salmonella enterica subsp. salamae]